LAGDQHRCFCPYFSQSNLDLGRFVVGNFGKGETNILLLLIGTSSSGKTTLARALQAALPDYWQYLSLDMFFSGVPPQYGGGANGPLGALGFCYENKATDASISYGTIGEQVLLGMISSAIAFVNDGTNLIFDDMILDESHAAIWRNALNDIDSTTVHLSAPIGLLTSRNKVRNNPPRLPYNHIAANKILAAELSLDSGEMTVEDCVAEVARHLRNCSQ